MNFKTMYRQYAPDVYRFALYLCGDVKWAEDITSETFLKAWIARDGIRQPTVKAYLLTIARNLYLKQVKRHRRIADLDEQMADDGPGPEASADQRARLQATLSALQTLDEIDRTVLLLRAVEDMPYREIAASLGMSVAAARVKVHRARFKLAQLCGFDEIGDES